MPASWASSWRTDKCNPARAAVRRMRARGQQGGQRTSNPGRPAYSYLPAARKVGRRTVLIAGYGYLRASLTMSLQTLVTQSSHARNNLMSVYERHWHRPSWRNARRRRCCLDPDSAGCSCAATGRRPFRLAAGGPLSEADGARRRGRPAPAPRRDHLVQAGGRRRGHRHGEMAITGRPPPPRPAGCVPAGLPAAKAGFGHGECHEYPMRAGDCAASADGRTA